MNILRKALQRGLTPANVTSYVCLQVMRIWGAFWGTLAPALQGLLPGRGSGSGRARSRACGPVALAGQHNQHRRKRQPDFFLAAATAATLAAPVRLRTFGPAAAILIGEGAQLSGTSITARSQHIVLGRQVLLAPNCVIVDSDFHAHWPPEARATEPAPEADAPVVIGDYAWIGMNCLFLKGVSIGEGAMIGAGSVVTRDVPPFCLAAGAPARVLRRLGAKDGRVTPLAARS